MLYCYICGRALQASPRDFGERVAAEIKPKGAPRRLYCARCWNEELAIAREKERHGEEIKSEASKRVKESVEKSGSAHA